MHESSKHFCFRCSLIPKLHHTNWLINIYKYCDSAKYIMCDI